MSDSMHRDVWLRASAAYVPSARVAVEEAIRQGLYSDADHKKDGYVSVSEELQWWPVDMALATTRVALGNASVEGRQLGMLAYASIHRHGNARLWQPAAYLQSELGAAQALAFSISHGCNGMFVAARLALDALRCHGEGNALIVGADRFGTSSFDRWRGDYGVVYGDAAVAALFGCAPGFARVLHLTIAGVPELEGMHRHAAPHFEVPEHAELEFGIRASKKAFLERYGRDRFFEAMRGALSGLRNDVLERFDLTVRQADWLVTPHLGRAISQPLYEGMFRDLAHQHFGDWGRQVGHTGTADQFLSLVALARSGSLREGQRVLLIGSGAGFSCGLMLLEIHDVALATACDGIGSLVPRL